jgi:hypothetical protein
LTIDEVRTERQRTKTIAVRAYCNKPLLRHSIFDPKQKAFYYVRVIEIPKPRWVVYDMVRLGAKVPKEAKLIHQERVYTSPIWYTP